MKISCQSCSAKYTIADEKVLGKIVKIRCKKCGSTIVINGNEGAAEENQDTRVFDYTDNKGGAGEAWTVNVADGDQRSMAIAEIVSEYKAGVLNDETFCWKDGMADWLPLREIGELYSAVSTGPRPSLLPEQMPDDGGGNLGALFGSPRPASSPPAASNGGGLGALFGAAGGGGAAARRAGGRGGGDLFGSVEKAGAEGDGLSASQKGEEAGKLTGQRNENSVLFSLSALTNSNASSAAPQNAPTGEGSGLIDIRALSTGGGPKPAPTGARVDDIMNLGGGGAFSPALAAPVLAPPPMEGGADLGIGTPPAQNKVLLIAIIGGLILTTISLVVVAVVLLRKPEAPPMPPPVAAPTVAPAPVETAAAATPSAPAAAADNTGGTGASSPGGGGGSKGPAGSSKSGGGGGAHAAPAAHGGGGGGGGGGGDTAPTPPPSPAQATSLEDAMRKSAGGGSAPKAAAASDSSASPFDRGAAAAALGQAAGSAGSCKKGDGPTGSGHVKVTFQPNGSVSTVEVDQPPYAGTSVGGCVAAKFRAAHVPAFSGGPVTVGKTFSIN